MPFVRYRDYLRVEGSCSLVLGLALALVALPGLRASYPHAWAAPLFVPVALGSIVAFCRVRLGTTWVTERPVRDAQPGLPALDPGPLKRRLIAETAVWIVAVCAWVLATGDSGLLVCGTGLASAAYGAAQLIAARSVPPGLAVARRPGLGTPDLTSSAA